MSEQERAGPENGLWLCQTCAKLVDNDPERFTVEVLRDWKSSAEKAALDQIGKTASKGTERFAAPLPEKLRAPRPAVSPEMAACQSLLRQCRFYLCVVQLVQDISQLPNHNITNIARPPQYDEAKRTLFKTFNDEYTLFMVDLENSIDILEELREAEAVAAVREVATTVAALVEWAEDPRNDPVSLVKLHPTSEISSEAREASMKLCKLAARRLIELEEA
jgi:hypothetical protein